MSAPRTNRLVEKSPRTPTRLNETRIAVHRGARPPMQRTSALQPVVDSAHYARLPLDKHAGTATARAKAPKDTPVTNSGQREHYTGAELAPYRGRPGAMDAYHLPSRMQNTLHWRDGRTAPHTASSALPANPAATTPAATPQPQAAPRARKSKGA